MLLKINKNLWRIFAIIAFVSIAIPMAIVFFVLITTDQESVTFLADSPPLLGFLILLYYALIIGVGIVWLVRRLLTIFSLKNETSKNELRHLQSQMNPHFLFNILNNVYGLVDKDAEKAKKLILKISDMMRYSIYDGQKELVGLAEEVTYLQNYISLNQMRYHKKSDIQFEVEVEDENLQIMPLMLIPLVENAFKHGMELLQTDAFIHILLRATKNDLYFEVVNNFDIDEIEKSKGMGLKNLKRRLSLMYPKKHHLTLEKTSNKYTVILKINRL